MTQLKDVLRTAEVLEPVSPEIAPRRADRKSFRDEVVRGARREYLTARRELLQTSGANDRLAEVVERVAQLRITRVQRHAHRDLGVVGPRLSL